MATEQTSSGSEPSRPKLLFADDHHLVLDALAFVATPQYEVRGADSLKAFEEALDEFAPDLVILDIHMPDGDGFEAGRRALERRPGLKLMFLSMHTEAKFVRRAMETGALAFISKRAPLEELFVAIRTVLDGEKYIGSPVQLSDTGWTCARRRVDGAPVGGSALDFTGMLGEGDRKPLEHLCANCGVSPCCHYGSV